MDTIPRHFNRRFIIAMLTATVLFGTVLNHSVAEAAGSTAVVTSTTCQPGTVSSTMRIAGARNQQIAVEFYIQKYNFSTHRFEFHWRGGYQKFRMPYVDPIDNSVGQAVFKRNISNISPGSYRVWAHVWFYNDRTRTWYGETWELPRGVDYLANGRYWTSGKSYCNMTF